MPLLAVLLSALALAPAPISAAPTSPAGAPPAPPPPAELEALRAEADAVIRRASAQAHVVNDTRRDFPAVRHTASGLRCLFQPGRSDNAIVWIGSAAGGGMGCTSRPVGFHQTLQAVRLAPGETLESVLEASVRDITTGRPDARLYEGGGMSVRVAPAAGLPPAASRSAAYLVRREGRAVFSRVSVAIVDGWVIRQQFEAPADQAEAAQLLAEVVMSTTLIDLASRASG
ncbi:MAG: hypothetical protein M3M95_06765 [Pseudomonadota bacterium]|nr:hypothetical protein [Pseudomonadota bacterium]